MNTFNFNRFSQALKCQFMVTRKWWMVVFGIYTFVLLMANLFFTRLQTNYNNIVENWPMEIYDYYNRHVEQTVAFGIFFFCVAMLYGISSMFSQMKDTRKRSAYLLWPVSNLEKYVVSFLLSFGLMLVLTVSAYVLADTLRVFIDWVTGRVVIWGIPKLSDPFTAPDGPFEYWQMVWMLFAWVFYTHSLYVVGGTLFRRQQFLLTSGTIIVTVILLTIILNQIDWDSAHFEFVTGTWDEKTSTYTHIFHPSFYIINSVVSLFMVFNYWASYKVFTRMQVINNKWLNI